jgi:hypothetical protein
MRYFLKKKKRGGMKNRRRLSFPLSQKINFYVSPLSPLALVVASSRVENERGRATRRRRRRRSAEAQNSRRVVIRSPRSQR